MPYNVIDLFAGAGGLSLGFSQDPEYNIVLAAEKNKNARRTYHRNHPGTVLKAEVENLVYPDILQEFGQIDVVIGGPPCQGFSNANRQKNTTISMNNRLVKEFVRAVLELRPLVFVMENVGALRSKVHKFYYSEDERDFVDNLNIHMDQEQITLLPPHIELQCITQLLNDPHYFRQYLWNKKQFKELNIIYKKRRNYKKLREALEKHHPVLTKVADAFAQYIGSTDEISILNAAISEELKKSHKTEKDLMRLIDVLEKPIIIQKMFHTLEELSDNRIVIDGYSFDNGVHALVRSYPVLEYIKRAVVGNNQLYNIEPGLVNAVNFGAPQKRERYIIIGVLNDKNHHILPQLPQPSIVKETEYRTVHEAIYDLVDYEPATDVNDHPKQFHPIHIEPGSLLELLRNSNTLYNHVITSTTEVAMARFKKIKSGKNFRSLSKDMQTNTYTDVERTQNTIYWRLEYNKPSGTVVNVRKSMWIHPEKDRAISIREAARLQTFPDSFEFMGSKDSQYQQVGNAVPPILSRAIAQQVLPYLHELKPLD